MRLLTTIKHPRLRISIFLHQNCFSVKTEDQLYQEIIFFRDGELANLEEFVDLLQRTGYADQAERRLAAMHQSRTDVLNLSDNAGNTIQDLEII